MIPPEEPWPCPPHGLTLAGAEVHVWRASLDRPASRLEEMWRFLSDDERQRAGRFHLARDRRRFVVRRGVLRSILGFYLGLDPGRVQFRYGPHGKPALSPGSGGNWLYTAFSCVEKNRAATWSASDRGRTCSTSTPIARSRLKA